MRYEFIFTNVLDTDEIFSRSDAFDVAEQVADIIRQKSGVILHVKDVDRMIDYDDHIYENISDN